MSGLDFTPVVNAVVESHANDLWEISRFLCENPELALEETKAHDKLCEFLVRRGFTVQRQHLLTTAFRAEFRAPGGSDGPTVAIMAEYDALPKLGHGCGHNLIAESSVGAALAVMAAMKLNPAIRGKIVIMGTPAEESEAGKAMLLRKGAFRDIDVAIMAHPGRQDCLRLAFTSSQKIKVVFRGKGTHAAASPWDGVNALDAAVASYVNVSLLRQQIEPACRIHGIILEGGTYSNIIPETSQLVYQVRGETAQDVDPLVARVVGCITAAAQATGCTVTIEKASQYKNFVHNVALSKTYRKHGQALGIKFTDADMTHVEKFGASTDAGNVSQELPTLHPVFAIPATDGNHTLAFAVGANAPGAQPPTLRAAKILALTALDLFTDPALLSEIKREFDEWKSAYLNGCQNPSSSK
ncbi:xaa-Arg dipeptidase-like [Haemaphysalis longicornis]